MTRKHFTILILLGAITGGAEELPPPLSADEVAVLISSLPYWRSDRELTAQEWGSVLKAAAKFQATPHEIRKAGVQRFYDRSRRVKFDGIGDELSKAFIMFRVAFDVSPSDPPYAGPWIGPVKRSAQWPVSVGQDGTLGVSALYMGSAARYLPQTDYSSTVAKYGIRDLKKLKAPLPPDSEKKGN